jgi:2'-5' RNA ligase
VPLGVQLDLDTGTEVRLKAVAARLDALPGLATVARLGDVHHVSLAICDGEASIEMRAALADFAATLGPFELQLGAIGIFPGDPAVLYLAPVVTTPLLALHRAFHEAMHGIAPPPHPHYMPGGWVPHVTLALDVAPATLPRAVDIVRDTWQPGAAGIAALRLIRFLPVEPLALYPFGTDGPAD